MEGLPAALGSGLSGSLLQRGIASGAVGALPSGGAMPPMSSAPSSAPTCEGRPSVAARLAAACQSALLGRTLQQFGGIVQVITEVEPPYRVLSVSSGWQRLCGYSRDEVLGKPLSIMQGPRTEKDAIGALMRAVRAQMPASVRLTNYTKEGAPFVHQLSCEPLRDPAGETRCWQATSLVLQAPGDAEAEVDPIVGSMPPICTNAVPPLWPLLGRAVRPDDTPSLYHLGSSMMGAGDASRPLSDDDSERASLYRSMPTGRTAFGDNGARHTRVPDVDQLDDEFFDWLDPELPGADLTTSFINRISSEMDA